MMDYDFLMQSVLIPIVAGMFGGIVVVLIRILRSKSATTSDLVYELESWASFAVESAEQLFAGEEGQAKLRYVLDFLSKKFPKVNAGELRVLVESIVYNLRSRQLTST